MLVSLLIQQPAAALGIVRQTPPWVWLLLAGLIALGLSQWRERRVSLARLTVLPVAMALLSLLGLVTAFAQGGALIAALGGWLGGFALVGLLLRRLGAPSGTRYEPGSACVHLPGSPWPLLLILTIFLKLSLRLRGRPESWPVSRLCAARFRAM